MLREDKFLKPLYAAARATSFFRSFKTFTSSCCNLNNPTGYTKVLKYIRHKLSILHDTAYSAVCAPAVLFSLRVSASLWIYKNKKLLRAHRVHFHVHLRGNQKIEKEVLKFSSTLIWHIKLECALCTIIHSHKGICIRLYTYKTINQNNSTAHVACLRDKSIRGWAYANIIRCRVRHVCLVYAGARYWSG